MSTRRTIVLGVLLVGTTAAQGADERLFREQVAPVLERRCVSCHGDSAPKGKLSLTTAEALRKGGETGAAVVPGRPDESLLVEMITGDAPEMPKTGGRLSSEQVASIRTWVEQGAHWPEGLALKDKKFEGTWWAFRPLKRPELPAVKGASWIRTPIDTFVLAELERRGLSPRPETDRRTLIRRLTFDLHGLPPAPQEIDAFVADRAPDAYARLVDRLLASPRYGERWGRHWLDVVHYGDTHGYDKDKRRDFAWPYRDYVIRSFNDDVPYARFVREQIAGDVLSPGDPMGIIATGFITAGPWDFVGHVELREGTVDKRKAQLNDRDDMLANTMSTFQSLTVHCARCHDHKFDPIPQKDYYRLQAVFAGVERGDRPYESGETAEKRAALERRKAEIVARHDALRAKADAVTSPELVRIDDELAELKRRLGSIPKPMSQVPSPSNGYHSDIAPTPDVVKWVQVDLGAPVPIDEIRLVPARPVDFPDTPGFGFPVRFRVELADEPGFAQPTIVADRTTTDVANPGDIPCTVRPPRRVARFVRVTASRLWKRTNDFVFALAELEVVSDGKNAAAKAAVSALDSIEFGLWGRARLVDGFDSRAKLDDLSNPLVVARRALQNQIQECETRRKVLKDDLVDSSTRAELERTNAERADVEARLKALASAERVYSIVPRPPRPIQLLRRGDVEQPGESIQPGSLSCVPGLDPDFAAAESGGEGKRRAALADWIANSKNMLTWRSIVNRVWHYHFGRGLVDTPNDFGCNGSLPSHPALLDWLAVEFLENGQSLKALHRTMVMSAVYRQSSANDPASAAVDADNRWLWRMNRRRLDAESLRDGVLAVSGQLDLSMGGPGFDLFRFKDDHSPIYDHTAPEALDRPGARRRTVYRFTVRSVPNPFLESLDCPDPNINTPVRTTTITALQALALYNDRFILRQSAAFARRLESLSPDPGRRIEAAYLYALGRPPRPEEKAALAAYADKHGLANASRLLFNTNEFVFID